MRDDASFTVDDERFATARVVGPSMLSLDGDAHSRHRAPFARAVQACRGAPGAFTEAVTAEADRLIDAIEPRGGARSCRRELAGPLAAAIVMRALGLDGTDTAAVLRWYDAIVASTTGLSAGRAGPPTRATAGFDLERRRSRRSSTAAATRRCSPRPPETPAA